MYYFDHAATTRVLPEAVQAACACMQEDYGNPSSLHKMGLAAENRVRDARRSLARALGCREGEVYFTSGATESNNLALLGAAHARRRRGNRIVTTPIEHASVAQTIKQLEKEGFEIVSVPTVHGTVRAQDVIDQVDDQTILVSTMFVNNETGLILPIAEIAAGVKQKNPNVYYHVDASQAFCKLPFSVGQMKIDLLSASGHKIYAPKGTGLLYIRSGVALTPRSFGGEHEKGVRAGTEAVPAIAAFGVAATLTHEQMEAHLSHVRLLRQTLLEPLTTVPNIFVLSPEDAAPYIVSLSVAGVRSEIMLHFLEEEGFCVSSGSACSKGAVSGVLAAMGFSREQEDTAVRISFGFENTEKQTALLARAIQKGAARLARS